MKKHPESAAAGQEKFDKVSGLGKHPLKESYDPELRQRLVESERFKALLNQSNDAIFLAQLANGRFVDANETARRLLGYTADELLKRSINDIIPVHMTIEVVSLSTDELPDPNNPNFITTQFVTKNGRFIPVELTLRKVQFQEVRYVVIVARNISKRLQTEEALGESESRFRWMAENISDGLMILEGEQVLYINEQASALLGYSSEQIKQMRVANLVAPLGKFAVQQIGQLSLETDNIPAEIEFWVEKQDGAQSFINFRLSQHQINPDTVRLYIVMTDITSRKEHEAELEKRVYERTKELDKANEQLKALNQLKSAFVSNVSHELRTPIANIQLYLSLIGQTRDTQKESRFLQILTSEAKRLGNLIEDLLILSRLENKKEDVSKEFALLDSVMAPVLLNYAASANRKNITFHHKPNPTLPPTPMFKERISQVFTNLLGNAVAYTPIYGMITITSRLEEDENGRFATLTIHNDGPPIPETDLPYIFDRFYRGENAKRSDVHGAGLGLAICQEIIHDHQGEITVHSAAGQGTAITVKLPL